MLLNSNVRSILVLSSLSLLPLITSCAFRPSSVLLVHAQNTQPQITSPQITSPQIAQSQSLSVNQIKNMTYKIPSETAVFQRWSITEVELQDGTYSDRQRSFYIQVIDGRWAFGDLNGDGWEDAAVILSFNYGGSGSQSYLATVINQNGRPVHQDTRPLSVYVQTTQIQNGKIVLDGLTHQSGDPHCCPSRPVTVSY